MKNRGFISIIVSIVILAVGAVALLDYNQRLNQQANDIEQRAVEMVLQSQEIGEKLGQTHQNQRTMTLSYWKLAILNIYCWKAVVG